jgi:hypothetical protein
MSIILNVDIWLYLQLQTYPVVLIELPKVAKNTQLHGEKKNSNALH